MNLRRINIHLLVILRELLETRNVTVAGQRLGLTQPATSAALAKLRRLFKDSLLVSVGRELQLTPRAEALRTQVGELIDSLEEMFTDVAFSPANLNGQFIIGTADYMPIVMAPHLLEIFTSAAPRLALRFTNINRNSTSHLKAGEIDMIIAPATLIQDPTLMSRSIFSDRFVCVYRCRSPTERRQIDLEEYLSHGHIATMIDTIEPVTRDNTFVREIDELRSHQKNSMIVPYYAALPLIAANSSLLALVQERLVKKFVDYLPIAYTEPPVKLPPLEYSMFWSPRMHRAAGHQWVRETISSVCHRAFPRSDKS